MRKHAFEYPEGNRLIDIFLFGRSDEDINASYATEPYHESWDLLMSVIRKIKEHVFSEGYDLFMPEHSSYVAIGNACYDADLLGAWIGAVRWICLRQDLQDVKPIKLHYELEENDAIVFKTWSNSGISKLKVSPHLIRRWKQRISEKTTIDEICDRVTGRGINESYEKHGNGVYYIGKGLVVSIDNYLVMTVYKRNHPEAKINEKVRDLRNMATVHLEVKRQPSMLQFVKEFNKSKAS